MQDRICQVDETSCNARPDHTFGSNSEVSALARNAHCAIKSKLVRPIRHIRFAPLAEIAASLDYLVGAGEKWRWHFELDPTGTPCNDDELEFRGLIERNFSGVLADTR